METMQGPKAIKTFFSRDDAISPGGGKAVSFSELKELSSEDRNELGQLACNELDVEFLPAKKKDA